MTMLTFNHQPEVFEEWFAIFIAEPPTPGAVTLERVQVIDYRHVQRQD